MIFLNKKKHSGLLIKRISLTLFFFLLASIINLIKSQYCFTPSTNIQISPTAQTQTTAIYSSGIRAFNFQATAGFYYNFSTCDLSLNDTYLRIYNSATGGSVIALNDDNCGLQSNLNWLCSSNGAYSVLLSKNSCTSLSSNTRMSYSTSISSPQDPCNNINTISCETTMPFLLDTGSGFWNNPGVFVEPGNEVVYAYTPTVSGQYTINVYHSGVGNISLYDASSCSSSGWNYLNYSGASLTSTFSAIVQLTNGIMRYFLIDDDDINISNGTIELICPNGFVNSCTQLNYGSSQATSPADEEIFNVTFGTLNNSSNCNSTAPGTGSIKNQYSNYTGSVTAPTLTLGNTYSISVTLGECNTSTYTGGVSVYIDYNANGIFTDQGENVWNIPNSNFSFAGSTYSSNILIPANTTIGFKRMRVIASYSGSMAPTAFYTYGETEDYCIQLKAIEASIFSTNQIDLKVNVYPNPSMGLLIVKLENNQNYKIVISNILGEVIYFKEAENTNSIDLIKFENGLYFLKILDNNCTLFSARIIKN